LAQPDVDAGESVRDRRGHRPFQRDFVPAHRLDQLDRQGLPGTLEREHPGVVRFPLDRDAGCLQDADDGFGHFRTDAVARNERDRVCHSRTYQVSSTNPSAMLRVSSADAVSAPRVKAEPIATASISSATAARGTKPCGGGPMNFIINRPTIVTAPHV